MLLKIQISKEEVMKKKLLLMFVTSALAMLLLVACGGGGEESSSEASPDDSGSSSSASDGDVIKMRLGHANPIGDPKDVAANKLAELINEKSDGRVEVEVFG